MPSSSLVSAVLVLVVVSLLLSCASAQPGFRQISPASDQWTPRASAALHYLSKTTVFRDGLNNGRSVSLSGYFLLYGGNSEQGSSNDVWASSNARQWLWAAGTTPAGEEHPLYPNTFDPALGAGHCQDSSLRQYYAAGAQAGQLTNDVWTSVDGSRWSEVTDSAEFDPVYYPAMTGDAAGAVYLAGGILELEGVRRSSPAVWMSNSQGRSWRPMWSQHNMGPGERAAAILLSPVAQQLLWLTGVDTAQGDAAAANKQDVWLSTNAGRGWGALTLQASFGRRDDAAGVLGPSGLLVVSGGYSGAGMDEALLNDVWLSANGGYSWGRCTARAEWDERRYHMSAVDGDGYVWVMGGSDADGYLSDLWRSVWTLNDTAAVASRCKLAVPLCGTGLKCLPNLPTTLLASDNGAVYCDACPYPCKPNSTKTE